MRFVCFQFRKAALLAACVCLLVVQGKDVTRFRRDTSFYADGSIDYENSDFDDEASPVAVQDTAGLKRASVADDRNDLVIEARKPRLQSDVTSDLTGHHEYLKEARANVEHFRNMGRIRSNDIASEPGLANFLASHAVKDDAEIRGFEPRDVPYGDWFAPNQRSVPQMAAGTLGEYEVPPQAPATPTYPQQRPYASFYQPQYPPPSMPMPMPAPMPPQYPPMAPMMAPMQAMPPMTPMYDFRPPNSNAVYARAMMVGMKPLGPPLDVNPAGPSLQSNFQPDYYPNSVIGPDYNPTVVNQAQQFNSQPQQYGQPMPGMGQFSDGSGRGYGVGPEAPVGGPYSQQEEAYDDEEVDDSKLEDLPEPAEDSRLAKKSQRLGGGTPGTEDFFYYNMFGGAGNVQKDGSSMPCPPGMDCSKAGEVKTVSLPSGKSLKVRTNANGKINVMIETASGPKPDPALIEQHMSSAIASAATVKEKIAEIDSKQPWNTTTLVTVGFGGLLAAIVGFMGFTIYSQRSRAAERQDSTTIQSKSTSKIELGQDLSDYCYREDVRRLAHILEDD